MRRAFLLLSFLVTVVLIDAQVPYLQWAKSLGGVSTSETVFSNSVAIDINGNVYTTGTIKNGTADLDPGTGTYNLDFSVDGGMFISKLDAAGNFVWAKQFGNGAATTSYAVAIAVDKSGNVYITGGFQGTGDFDPGAAVENLTSAGNEDIFILKLDTDGNFVWVKRIGGAESDAGSSIAVDTIGTVYTTGWYNLEVDFDPGAGVYNLPSNGCPTCVHYGAYVLKLDTDGNLVWAKQLGAGIGDAIGEAITIDASGNVYTTGDFSWLSADFDPGPGTFTLGNASPNHKTFISKLDESGNFVWASGLYAIGYNDYPPSPHSIKVDGSGNVITAGYYTYRTDFDPGIDSFNLSPSNLSIDIYISKLDASGNFVWAKSIGSTSTDKANSIALDAASNVYAIGEFYGTVDFDPGPGTYSITSRPSRIDIFMLKLNASGDFAWATDIAPTSDPYNSGQQAIAVDESGNIYAAGLYFGTTDFDPGTGEYNLIPSGASDIFVLKLGPSSAGTSEYTKISDISIFPNPAAAEINILFSKIQKDIVVKLIDINGKTIQTTNFSGNQLVINQGEIPDGIYFLQITDGINTIETRKIIFH